MPLRDPPGPPASGRQAGSSPNPGTQQTSINTDHDPDTLLSKRDPQNVPNFKEFVVKKEGKTNTFFVVFYFATVLNAKARSHKVSGQNPEISDRKKNKEKSPHHRIKTGNTGWGRGQSGDEEVIADDQPFVFFNFTV